METFQNVICVAEEKMIRDILMNQSPTTGISLPDLSIIIPINNEEENIVSLYQKLFEQLQRIQRTYEIIIVDDGSIDSTFEKITRLQIQDPRIKIIKFRKNFGKSTALNVAFHYAKGQVIITMDGDLQDDPGDIPQFLAKIDEGFDLVSGWKYPRFDPLTKTIPSKFFNKITCLFTGVDIHDFNCGFKAYKRVVIKNIQLYGEMHRYIPALAAWKGFKITEIKIRHHPRVSGKSKYGFSRLIKGVLDLITVKFLTNYASRPLHVFGLPGFASLFVGLIIGIYLVLQKYIENIQIGERPLLLLSILLILIGLQFISLGLIGEMLAFREMREQNPDQYIETLVE
ncbi:MAG: glycosyltransferase family 2 protein [Methanoregula sp.]